MKIIKYGDGYPIQIICSKCKSTLEIELADIHKHTECFVLKQEHTKYIICPVCGEANTIEKEVVTYEVRK